MNDARDLNWLAECVLETATSSNLGLHHKIDLQKLFSP